MVVISLSVGYNELAEREYCSGQALGTYNSLNQLKTVSDGTNTASYNYDNGGNITSKTVNGTTISYGYADTNWKDKLTSYNGQSITYDNLGNPLSYRGMTMDWTGRRLDSIVSNGTTSSYLYDANGIRTRKTVGSTTTDYFTNGSTILAEKTGSNVIWYIYDSDGDILGFTYNGTPYYYLKNAQGDVVSIVDAGMNVVGSYTYDAWGKVTSASGSMANVNPIRYRSYYYDTETGLYSLQSRYYDPGIGRFINADGYVSTGQGILGNNMFAYCGNNPVMRADPSGHFWSEIWEFAKTAVSEIGKAIGVMSPAYAGCGGAAVADGPLPIGDIIGAAGALLLTVGAIGYGIYQATQAPSISIPKVEEKEKDITAPLPNSTVIYRYGGTNPGNLTPKAKDKYTGLSFSTVPMPGAAKTTIEALNATGLVYAIQDGATHVSVRPIGGTMDDWINAGSGSSWTQAVKSVVVKWDGAN